MRDGPKGGVGVSSNLVEPVGAAKIGRGVMTILDRLEMPEPLWKRLKKLGKRAQKRALADWPSGGRPPREDRVMVTARWWVLRTGAAWRDVPREFGPWSSVYTRWRRWSGAGLWRRVVRRLWRLAVGRLWLADGSHIKVHQHGANPTGGQAAQAIGRTKGGLNSKLTVLADTHGRIVG